MRTRKININHESDLYEVANSITGGNSELYGDEVMVVVGKLAVCLRTAETFGIVFTDKIPDMWGGEVVVTAYPSTRRHHWTF